MKILNLELIFYQFSETENISIPAGSTEMWKNSFTALFPPDTYFFNAMILAKVGELLFVR